MPNAIAYLDESTGAGWERSLYAFLAEKQRRSGSARTVQSYSRMLQHFFGSLDKAPDEVTSQEVLAWAYGRGLSGQEPSSITIGARIACLSSFYRFLIRMKVVTSNPCDPIERPRAVAGSPRGLSGEQIRRLLDVIPRTPVGLRDRAIILTLTFSGRRRAEVLGMTAASISEEAGTVFYSYRGKGGKTGKRELPRPAFEAIETWLTATGKKLAIMAAGDSLCPDICNGRGITSGTFYTNLRRYLKKPDCPTAASTSSGTPQPSSGVTPASLSRRFPATSTTAAWRSRRLISGGWRGSRTRAGRG